MTRANPIWSFGSGVSPVLTGLVSLFSRSFYGENGSTRLLPVQAQGAFEFPVRVNSSLGHRCGGDNNLTDPYVVGGELVGLWLGWTPVFGSYGVIPVVTGGCLEQGVLVGLTHPRSDMQWKHERVVRVEVCDSTCVSVAGSLEGSSEVEKVLVASTTFSITIHLHCCMQLKVSYVVTHVPNSCRG